MAAGRQQASLGGAQHGASLPILRVKGTSLYTSQITPYESRTYKGSSGGIAPSLLHADTPEALAARGSGRCT